MDLAILVTTYAPPGGELRVAAAERSLASWKEHLKYDGGFYLYVADDGSDPELGYNEEWWRERVGDWATLGYSSQRKGLGPTLNTGIAACAKQSPYMLYPMDDWALVGPLVLDPWVAILKNHEDVGCLRMGQPSGAVRNGHGRRFGQYVTVSFERYAFYWSLTPALYHQRFFEAYGLLIAGAPSKVEKDYNVRICTGKGPDVLVAQLTPWQHLWSIRLGDIGPGQAVPEKRLAGKLSTEGYSVQ